MTPLATLRWFLAFLLVCLGTAGLVLVLDFVCRVWAVWDVVQPGDLSRGLYWGM